MLLCLQMSLLRCENVALQAKLEEQSVHTEQLEYELTKAKKTRNKEKSFTEQREAQDEKVISDLKGKLLNTIIMLNSAS